MVQSAVRFAIISMGASIETQLVNCATRLVRRLDFVQIIENLTADCTVTLITFLFVAIGR